MKKVKLGFIGVGFMGQLAHISNYAHLGDDCEIVAIAEPKKLMAEKVAQRYGAKQIFSDHHEMLANCELDAIVAVQRYANHINIVPEILNAKIPLLTEKPLCVSVENGEKLVKCAEDNNTLHMMAYHKRSDPAMEYAKGLIDEWKQTGEFGEMRLVRISMPDGNWIAGATGHIRSDEVGLPMEWEEEAACFEEKIAKEYNAFVNYYIHQVNAMRFIFGESYKVTYADKAGVIMAVESESGVSGVLEMAAYKNTIDWQECVFVAFEKGYIKVELPPPLASQQAGRVTVMKDNGKGIPETIQPHMPKLSAMRNQAINFIAAVRGERPAPCVSKEALEDLKIAMEYIKMKYDC